MAVANPPSATSTGKSRSSMSNHERHQANRAAATGSRLGVPNGPSPASIGIAILAGLLIGELLGPIGSLVGALAGAVLGAVIDRRLAQRSTV